MRFQERKNAIVKKKLLTRSRFNLAFSSKNIQNRPIIQSKQKSKLITISRALKRYPKNQEVPC